MKSLIGSLCCQEATRNKCHATRNRCLTSSNKKLLGAPGIATSNKKLLGTKGIATNGAIGRYSSSWEDKEHAQIPARRPYGLLVSERSLRSVPVQSVTEILKTKAGFMNACESMKDRLQKCHQVSPASFLVLMRMFSGFTSRYLVVPISPGSP